MRELLLMESQFIYYRLAIFILLVLLFGVFLYVLNFTLYSISGPKYAVRHTSKVYEFGTTTVGNSQTLNNSHFLILSALFIIFDVELFLLYLWVAGLGINNTLSYKSNFILFSGLLFAGLVYELSVGALT